MKIGKQIRRFEAKSRDRKPINPQIQITKHFENHSSLKIQSIGSSISTRDKVKLQYNNRFKSHLTS